MQRFITGVAALVLVGLAGAPAVGQDVPEEARKAIAKNLQGSFMVYRDKVQDDLKLTDEQKDTLAAHLKERLPDFMKFFEGLGEKKADEREKELKAFRQKEQEKLAVVLKDTLKAEQSKRLRQLLLQQEGSLALWESPDVGAALKITDEQRKQFMAIVLEMQKKVEPLVKEAQKGGNAEEIRPKIMKVRKEYEGKLEALLTDAQKKQWKEMLGKALTLDD
jgi:hypothetical protein